MERVRKTFFDPLATSKAQIRAILEPLPVGSAHPFSPERILLCRTEHGIDEIDISSYPEDYFFNAVDLGEMGEVLLKRMAGFESQLKVFEDFQIVQAPASTFKVPIVPGQITVLVVSERTPTYYDFCLADVSCNTCCYAAITTLPGITHSGDVVHGNNLLQYIKVDKNTLREEPISVFISGYQYTQITKFLGTHPALLVANHEDKVLNIIPVPLDAATIGDASICSPLVIKRDGDSLICSILPTAATDRAKMCSGSSLRSSAFPEAIARADFTISTPSPNPTRDPSNTATNVSESSNSKFHSKIAAKETAVITTNLANLPSFLDLGKTQVINFGTGLEFKLSDREPASKSQRSSIVLPCIFGSQLEGPVLLATGTVPSNVPFLDGSALRNYYAQLKNIVVIVDDRMTDNARNLATSYRINALFIVQLKPQDQPKNTDDVLSLLDSANINAVTALAGPQSLVLIQIFDKYYFYRGIANTKYLNTSGLAFGSDVTSVFESIGMESIVEPRAERIVNLADKNPIIFQASGRLVHPEDIQGLFEELSVDQIQRLEDDINAAVPQLQLLLNQKDLRELSKALVSSLSSKVNNATAPLRTNYTKFLTQEYKSADPESVKTKNNMLGLLRKTTKEMQKALESVISSLANMMSSQTTSKRTHDLKRLVRQAQIQGNVEAVKAMTFDTLGGLLETYATDMGVMLLNIETTPYRQLLGNLNSVAIDASSCCDLDSRVLYLEGFDAGIIIEQSQDHHDGPLQSQNGPSHPILALPYLNQERGTGSMLAWVCWDEFVNLESPYTVRWVDKCNEGQIAALRIIMRDTLSRAVASREHNFLPSGPEIGNLMSALLMAAMSKLAAMRTTAPGVVDKAEDSVTRLMRGLFGNLLTIAGSGMRPMSMVWQLFGLNSNYEVPTTNVEWLWYENVVTLYPFTGWPLQQFYANLQNLLGKVIIRVVTKNENVAEIRLSRYADMIKYCELRNIQLEHSRTIITIFMRMLTTPEIDIAPIAARLLEHLPHTLEKQTQSYAQMIKYLSHLAKGGPRRSKDDIVIASVYTKRSAAFAKLKMNVSEACTSKIWDKVKSSCETLLDEHAKVSGLWHVESESLKFQNMKAYKDLLTADLGDNVDDETKAKNQKLIKQVLGDAEQKRVPWHVGKEGQFGDNIEPLNEAFLHEILTGETPDPVGDAEGGTEPGAEPAAVATKTIAKRQEDDFAQFKTLMLPSFITTMEKELSAEEACKIMNISTSAMRVFIRALNPDFVWENLGKNFRGVILMLLKDRSNRVESRPAKKLLELGTNTAALQIEG